MQRLKIQAPVLFSGVVITLTTVVINLEMGGWNRAEAIIAQKPLKATPLDIKPIDNQLCRGDLESSINSVIENPRFKTAKWGILIKSITEGKVLYQFNPNTSLIPASNTKLLTTAAAIKIFSDRNPEKLSSLRPLLTAVNRYSNNSKAKSLLRRIGGKKAAKNALNILGIHTNTYRQVDGSGLSRNNRAQPSTLVSLLEGMYTGTLDQAEENLKNDLFYNSLAIAGVNGTLRNRFHNTMLQGRLHGKTGTLRGVRTLSGYLENADYGTIAFSIMVNQPGQSGMRLTQAIDQILLQTAKVNRCD